MAFVLAFVIMSGSVPVTQVNAGEMGEGSSVSENGIEQQNVENDLKQETQENVDENSEDDAKQENDLQELLNDENLQKNDSEKSSEKEEDVSVSRNEMEESKDNNDNDGLGQEKDTEESSEAEDNSAKDEITDSYPVMLMSDADTTAPVIESFEFVENTQKVSPGDIIHIKFKGYDADKSEFSIKYTKIEVNFPESNSSSSIKAESITSVEGSENEYIIGFQVYDYYKEEKVEITALVVGDAVGNAATKATGSSDAEYPYFNVVKSDSTEIVVDNISLSNTSIKLTDENVKEEVQIEFQFAEGKEPQDTSGTFQLRYEYKDEEDYVYVIYESVYYSNDENGGKWNGTLSLSHGRGAGTYVLSEVTYNGEKITVNNKSSFTLSITHTDVTAPVIESVEAYWGDTKITEGKTIEREGTIKFRVKVQEDSAIYDSFLTLNHDLTDSADNSRFVSLKPGEESGYYVGEVSLTATEYEADMRATEWYVGSVYFSDVYSNTTNSRDYDTIYFYIKDESGIQLPEYSYTVCIQNSNGNYDRYPVTTGRVTSLDEIFPDGVPYNTEKEGYTFEGWDIKKNGVDSKILQTSDSFTIESWMSEIHIRPVYDKVLVKIAWYYYDENKDYCSIIKEVKCNRGTTYGDLLESELDKVVHSEEFGFVDWKIEDDLAQKIEYDTSFLIRAQYREKILCLFYYYYDKGNKYNEFRKGICYEEGKTTYQNILDEYLVADDAHRNGFTHWEYYFTGSDLKDVISGEQPFLECYPRYSSSGNTGGSGGSGSSGNTGGTDGSGSSDNTGSTEGSGNSGNTGGTDAIDTSTEFPVVVETEENKEKEEETVKDTTAAAVPQLRQENTVPEFTALSVEEETTEVKPAVKLEEEVVAQKVEEIQNAEEGTTFVVEMTKEDGEVATEVPVAVLEVVRGKDVNIVLDMGGYSWTINGQDVLAVDLSAVNLEVTMDTEAVAPSIVEKLAGGEPTRQISLTYNGDFGFKASLTINVGSEHEGEFGNLYYHDSNGKLVFMNAGQIDEDGNVSLDFSHASDYVVVVGRDRTEEESKKSDEAAEESMPAEIIDEEVVPVEKEEETAGSGLILVVIVVIVIAAVGIILVKKNKK